MNKETYIRLQGAGEDAALSTDAFALFAYLMLRLPPDKPTHAQAAKRFHWRFKRYCAALNELTLYGYLRRKGLQ